MDPFELSPEQIERYSRHILLAEVGGKGQKKLLESSALMVGAGGLGSSALLYLAAAGVGKLGIVDSDQVDLSNLQRQVIHDTAKLGKNKAESAAQRIKLLNPDCRVETHPLRLAADNAREIIRGWDVVLDGSDNFPTRYLVADACRMEAVPLVSAAAVRFQGQLMVVLPQKGKPCYRCIFPEPPPPGMVPTCREAGILGAVPGVMGSLQALEAVKLLLGMESPLSEHLLVYDALAASFFTVKRAWNPQCPLCGEKPKITSLQETAAACPDQEAPPPEP